MCSEEIFAPFREYPTADEVIEAPKHRRILKRWQSTNDGLPSACPEPLTVFLDLDDTLVYSSHLNEDYCDFSICLESDDKRLFVQKRPHLDTFLSQLAGFCKLILYTSAAKPYAEEILQTLDPLEILFQRIYFKSAKGQPMLTDPARSLIVCVSESIPDNMKANAITVTPFSGDPYDSELLRVLKIINGLSGVGDVREEVGHREAVPDFFKGDVSFVK